MRNRLNLAKRPFVDTRPANLAAGVLVGLIVILGFSAYRTVALYLDKSARTRQSIASLEAEIKRLDEERIRSEAALARIDFGQLSESAADINEIARLSNFSWTRFLTRLERTLPWSVRAQTISLTRPVKTTGQTQAVKTPIDSAYQVRLALIAREADQLPKVVRAFYGSPYFDRPEPGNEESPETGSAEGWKITLDVYYKDDPTEIVAPPPMAKERATASPARPSAAPAGPRRGRS